MPFTIKTLNSIRDAGLAELGGGGLVIDDDAENPDGIVLRSADLHSRPIPDNVKGIARAGAGVNNIPIEECNRRAVVVFNTPGANANGVKELVVSALLLSSRRISEGIEWTRSIADRGDEIPALVEKEKKRFAGPEIAGKTLGIVGLGAIGVMVANAASELGMNVIGYDPYISVSAAWGLRRNVKRAKTLDELLPVSDYLTVHAPLSEKTEGLIGKDVLSGAKRGVGVINVARGPLVDECAILEALDDGTVSRYATDFPTSRLLQHPEVIPIPHLGASTLESEDNCAIMAARQLREFLTTGNITNSVNFPDCAMPVSDDYRIVIANRNIPNMVGQIARVLGEENANISDLINRHRDGLAYNILDLDGEISDAAIEELRGIDGVITARVIGRTNGT